MIYANGDRYEGDWCNDKKDGKGKLRYSVGLINYDNGDKYSGDWKDDKRDGKGDICFYNRVFY